MSHLPGCHQGFPSCLPLPKEYMLPFCSANHKAGSFHFIPLVAGLNKVLEVVIFYLFSGAWKRDYRNLCVFPTTKEKEASP